MFINGTLDNSFSLPVLSETFKIESECNICDSGIAKMQDKKQLTNSVALHYSVDL